MLRLLHVDPFFMLRVMQAVVHSLLYSFSESHLRLHLQGHFQVLFDQEHCPIFQNKLSWLQRIMYLQVPPFPLPAPLCLVQSNSLKQLSCKRSIVPLVCFLPHYFLQHTAVQWRAVCATPRERSGCMGAGNFC